MKAMKTAALAALMLCCTLWACSHSSEEPEPDSSVVPGAEPTMESRLLTGVVTDADGMPLADVAVTSGEAAVRTSASGAFSLDRLNVAAGRSVVRFSKAGYFEVVRSVKAADEAAWQVVLCRKSDPDDASIRASYPSGQEMRLEVGELKIDMPRNGYRLAGSGAPYDDTVTAEAVYLDPNDDDFADKMPGGDLAALRADGSEAQLISYGMVGVDLTDTRGNRLQLAEGSTATVTFPVPEGMESRLPASIPLWSFDEARGLWVEEGAADLQDGVYVGQVKHFSWWNLDYPSEQGAVEGTVRSSAGGVLPGIKVSVGQITVTTDREGRYSTEVPAGVTFRVGVKSVNYGGYRPEVFEKVGPLSPREVRTVDLTLPRVAVVTGRVIDRQSQPVTSAVWIEYGTRSTRQVINGSDGRFSLPAPVQYRGEATLVVDPESGTDVQVPIVLTGEDLDVGDIIIKQPSVIEGGDFFVHLSDGRTRTLNITKDDGPNGVIVLDGQLVYETETEKERACELGFTFKGYDPAREQYDSWDLYLIIDRKNSQYEDEEVLESRGKAKIAVRRSGGKMFFDFDGKGNYYHETERIEATNVPFDARNFSRPLMMIARTARNVVPASPEFPNFTPKLAGAAPAAIVITDSPMLGIGGMLCYNGTLADYRNLKAQAGRSNIPCMGEDVYEGDYEVVYWSNGKYIDIAFDPHAPAIDGTTASGGDLDIEAQVTVTALDGVTFDPMMYDPTRAGREGCSLLKRMLAKYDSKRFGR